MRDVVQAFKGLFPVKPALSFKEVTGLSLRQCEDVMAEAAGISADTLRQLLRSDDGFEYLRALMGEEALPAWFLDYRYFHDTARLEADLARAREALKATKKMRNRQVAGRT